MNNSKISNRLINEKSPYLLQHAYNPVQWFPWGKEAFDIAKSEDKPIFLSIGYSTCHWCHVMAHESFEDKEIASILNRYYIAVKVDKEERPDIDTVYMTVCQALTGSGGWPMTILMTPEQKPFFAGTYFPKKSRYSMHGLTDILTIAAQKWKTNKKELLRTGEEITNALERQEKDNSEEPTRDLFFQAKSIFSQSFDMRYGGFGNAPKFPTPHNLMFLLRYYIHENNAEALDMAEKTLEMMFRGGLFDHIGGGFSRYSTDEKWLAPHFEKMLYDNALLINVYLEAYQITHKNLYRFAAEKTLSYIMREMTDEQGGFYSAQDADSEGVEGKYYIFTPNEIIKILGDEDGLYFNNKLDITQQGNFEEKSIPNRIEAQNVEEKDERLQKLCDKIYEYRLSRTKLHKDDKILTPGML